MKSASVFPMLSDSDLKRTIARLEGLSAKLNGRPSEFYRRALAEAEAEMSKRRRSPARFTQA